MEIADTLRSGGRFRHRARGYSSPRRP